MTAPSLIQPNLAPSVAQLSCVDNALGLQQGDRIEISRLLRATVLNDATGAPPCTPLPLLSTCPLVPGVQFNSPEEAAAAIDLPWRCALRAVHLLGHRVAKTAVSSEIDLQGVFHPLWRQTLTLSFTSELVARVTRAATPQSAWLAGLCFGLARLSLAFRLTKSTAEVHVSDSIRTNVAAIDTIAKHFDIDKLLPPISREASPPSLSEDKPIDRPWNVAATATQVLSSRESGWLIVPTDQLRPAKLSPAVTPALAQRLNELERQTILTCNALWRCPLGAAPESADDDESE